MQWPQQNAILTEIPSMHPRGRSPSSGSTGVDHRPAHIYSIQSDADLPPKYEDALINSKPANLSSVQIDMKAHQNIDQSNPNFLNSPPSFQSAKDQRLRRNTVTHAFETSANSMTQLALNIVRGFATIDAVPDIQQPPYRNRSSFDHGTVDNMDRRKLSFCQLDVNELLLTELPPKYSELSFNTKAYENVTSRGSNEPHAGE